MLKSSCISGGFFYDPMPMMANENTPSELVLSSVILTRSTECTFGQF
jgi:hypothetical protein